MKLKNLFVRQTARPLIRNHFSTNFPRNALIVYITGPFSSPRDKDLLVHQNRQQVLAMAQVLSDLEYNVDVVDFNNSSPPINHTYDLIIDIHPGHSIDYGRYLASHGKRVAYLTGGNPKFSNAAGRRRLWELFKRRLQILRHRRKTKEFSQKLLLKHDAFLLIGNRNTSSTYQFIEEKRIFFVPNTGYDFLAKQGFGPRDPKSFLFFASDGQVHKGLDLVLEAFIGLPELKLYVCSNFSKEKDFTRAYRKELFQTENIVPVGFISIESPEFQAICSTCTFAILPSCSEAMVGSMLTTMSAGLIPLTTRESGIDLPEELYLSDISIKGLKGAIQHYSQTDHTWRSQQSERVVSQIAQYHTLACYVRELKAALITITAASKEDRTKN